MKIVRRPITASTSSSINIPSPYNKYYEVISDAEMEEETGMEAHPSPCEDAEGYDIEWICYLKAKPEYEDALADNGMDWVELIKEDGKVIVAYTAAGRIFEVSEDELPEDVEAKTKVKCCDKKVFHPTTKKVEAAIDTGLQYWYYGRHGLGPGTIPPGVTVLDTVEEGWKTWMLLDKLLTTEELNYYDLKEQWPPEGSISHNGVTIEGATAEELQKAFEEYAAKQNELGQQLDDLQENVKKKSGLFDRFKKKKTAAATVTKVDEDDDSISYIVGEEDVEAGTLISYKNCKIMPDSDMAGWNIYDKDMNLLQSGLMTEKEARKYVDVHTSTDVYADDEVEEEIEKEAEVGEPEEEEDEFESRPAQEHNSAGTAINGKQGKLPMVFKKASIPSGGLILDYGGGTVESEQVAQNYLDQFDAVEMLYDPYNQTAEHNREIVKSLKSAGGADAAVCSNVLNVIKEEEARLDVLTKMSKLMKNGAVAYISVYEGSGKGEGSATQQGKSYQNNRKLDGYLEEVQQVFPDAVRKGQVIVAPKTSSGKVAASTNIEAVDLDQLKQDIIDGCNKYLTSPEGGFLMPGTEKESQWDMFADEIYVVEVWRENDHIEIQVRAELDYNGMENLKFELDDIVEKYDPDAYFEQVEPGIMEAYLWANDIVAGATEIEGAVKRVDKYNDEVLYEEEKRRLEPDDEDVEPEIEDDVEENIKFDTKVEVSRDGDFNYVDGDPFDAQELADKVDKDVDSIIEDFNDLLVWHLPSDPGIYTVKGQAVLSYSSDWDNWRDKTTWKFDNRRSNVNDVEVIRSGNIESSTAVEAAMTEEDLDYAIENGKPFDLDSFKKYKTIPPLEDSIKAEDVKVGDVISIEEDASEVNLGTVVEVLAINDPKEHWIDYSFQCKVVQDPGGMQGIKEGSELTLHFDEGEYLGPRV